MPVIQLNISFGQDFFVSFFDLLDLNPDLHKDIMTVPTCIMVPVTTLVVVFWFSFIL